MDTMSLTKNKYLLELLDLIEEVDQGRVNPESAGLTIEEFTIACNKKLEELNLKESSRLLWARQEYNRVKDWINLKLGICIYCGEAEEEKDHLLPKSWTGKAVRRYVPTVPCCRKCNIALSDYPSPIIRDRCNHIADSMKVDPRYDVLRSGGCGG